MTRPVFAEPSVARDGWLGWAESNINFYLESTMPEAIVARAWINAAYERFPDPTGEFAGRLRSADFVQHASALAELYVHDRLLGRGHRVVYEEDGTGPDFRIYRDDEYLGAVEVCSLFDNKTWDAEQQRNGQIVDELNRRIPLGSWFIHIDIIRLERQPSIKRLVAWLKARLAELPEEPDTTNHRTPWITYQAEGAELSFQFRRRRSSSPPKPTDRIVGIGPVMGGFVDSFQRLRSTLEKKVQKRYDTRGEPLAFFVVAWDTSCTLDQFIDALFGNEQVAVYTGEVTRANNGFFGRNRERPTGKHPSVSSIFALRRWQPWQPDVQQVLRFDNPFGATSFPDDLLPADHTLAVMRDERRIWPEWRPCPPDTSNLG